MRIFKLFSTRLSAWRESRSRNEAALNTLLDGHDELSDRVGNIAGQVEELVRHSRRRETLVVAAGQLADTFVDEHRASVLSSHLTCEEVAALADLLRTAGHHEAASWWEEHNDPEGLYDPAAFVSR
ncbi:hypothetical protein ACWDUX_30395 [Streptomyces sp. NPDC003444]